MPNLDVSHVLSDPMLSDCFTVKRNGETIDSKGRSTTTVTNLGQKRGVITQQDPATLMRRDDGQMAPRNIFIATTFALRGVSTGNQPDTIDWNNSTYTVKEVLPYSRYGRGTYEVVAEAMTATNKAQ